MQIKLTQKREKKKPQMNPNDESDFRNPIQPLPLDEECEMSLKQFGSITDLLTKLRADLRASFPR